MLFLRFSLATQAVVRNGITFQIPLSNHSSWRGTVHSSGTGEGWDEAAPDIGQPHGLDFRELQDVRKGVRKRIAKEHKTFGDVTAGGDHLPGGCRILGIVENTSDLSKGYGDADYDVTDGKFIGRGLIYDQSNNCFWCATNSDGTTSGDPYRLRLHPDRAWAGGDVTWAGAHEFDASVDISGNTAIDGDVSIDGELIVDGTASAFGGTAGIGLFYDPTAYAGGESITLPNGLILKQGNEAWQVSATITINFAVAFPTAATRAFVTVMYSAASTTTEVIVSALSTTTLTLKTPNATATSINWFVIGY